MDNRYNRHNRRKYNLKVHIVLVTKYRKQLLKDSIADDVKQKIFDIANEKVISHDFFKSSLQSISFNINLFITHYLNKF